MRLGLLVTATIAALAVSPPASFATSSRPWEGCIIPMPGNPRWLARYPQKPFFMCGPGDPEDFLYRGELQPDGTRRGDQISLIRKLARTGANCIYMIAVRSHGGDGDETHNPFVGHDPSKDLNEAVLDQWDWWLTEMDRAGIVAFFILYDDSARLWDTGDEVGDQERAFIHGLVKRLGHHRNLIWCVAEEYQEALSPRRVINIAREIRRADDWGHPIAVHKLPGTDFAEFADQPLINQFAIQLKGGSADQLHAAVVEAWRKARGRYNLNMAEAPGFGTGRQLRDKLWACATAGAYVMVIGMDIAHTSDEDLKACGILRRFFEATGFAQMAPHDELGAAETTYVMAAPGRSYILYGRDVHRALGVRLPAGGQYMIRWVDCATGRRRQSMVRLTRGPALLRRPAGFSRQIAACLTRVGR